MIRLHSIRLKNVITYKDAFLTLDTHPITVIRGRNLDAKNNPNGAGKSLLMSCIGNVVEFEPPMAVRRNTAKDLHEEGSEIELSLSNGKHEWSLQQFGNGRGVTYGIFKNGENQRIREIKQVKKVIRKVFPYSLDQFYSLVYLNGYQSNLLLRGTGPKRLDLFEELFGFDQYDKIYDHARALVSKASESRYLYHQLLKDLEAMAKPVPLHGLKARVKKLRRKLNKLTERSEKLLRTNSRLNTYLKLVEDYQPREVSEIETDLKAVRSALKQHQEQYRQAERLQEQLKAYFRYRKQRKRLKAQLKHLPKIENIEELRERRARVQKSLSLLETDLRVLEAAEDALRNYEDYLPKFEKLWKDERFRKLPEEFQGKFKSLIPKHHKLTAYLVQWKRNLDEQETGLASSKDSCVVCGTQLGRDHHKRLHKQVKRDRERLEFYLDFANKLEKFARLTDRIAPIIELSEVDTRNQVKKLRATVTELEAKLESHVERQSILRSLKELEPVNKPSDDLPNTEDLERQIETEESKISKLERQLNTQQQIVKLGFTKLDPKTAVRQHREIEELSKTTRTKLATVNDLLRQSEIRLATERHHHARYNELMENIAKVKRRARHLPVYRALADAYGPKGLRLDECRHLAELYISNLNRNSGFINGEPFQFSSQIKNREFSLIAKRGKKSSDVRHLSGFESRAFALLSLMSVLPLVPARNRTNIAVLDEMESGLSRESRETLVNDLLPKLNQVIPNLFLITPMSKEEFSVPGAREVLVVKKGGVSRIEDTK